MRSGTGVARSGGLSSTRSRPIHRCTPLADPELRAHRAALRVHARRRSFRRQAASMTHNLGLRVVAEGVESSPGPNRESGFTSVVPMRTVGSGGGRTRFAEQLRPPGQQCVRRTPPGRARRPSRADDVTIVDRFGPLRELPDWLVAAADPARVAAALPASLPELGGGRLRVLEVDPGRARLKADRWTIRYRVTLRDDAGHIQTRRLLGTLEPPNGSPGVGGLGPLGVRVEPEPPDDELPALALLVDPEAARAVLEAAIVAQAPRLGDLR